MRVRRFAHHQGIYISLAYADHLEGPWRVHRPGVLDLRGSFFDSHIASPDVNVLDDIREIRMYYHGCCLPQQWSQVTRLATSEDGLDFTAQPEILGSHYWRVFKWMRFWYTLEMPGTFRRSRTGVSEFEEGPTLFTRDMRHSAVQLDGDMLNVFYSNAHDCPESILWATIRLKGGWKDWQASSPTTLLRPDTEYEGADCPVEASQRNAIHHRVHQHRDPCIFEDNGKTYLLYSVAGEYGIAIAELISDAS